MRTCFVFGFVLVDITDITGLIWLIYPYSSGLFLWHRLRMIAPVITK